MKRFRIGFVAGALLMAAAFNGCFIGVDDFSKTCTNASTCPKVGGYVCASTEKWPQTACDMNEKGCLCEVKFPPDPYDAGSVGGGQGGSAGGGTGGSGGVGGGSGKDAGPPVDYCTEVKPVVNNKCLGTCHSSQMGYPNSPKGFRLDYYESRDGGLPGLKDQANRAYIRANDNSMPPPVEQAVFPTFTAAEKAMMARWVDAGAPFGSGTCESDTPVKDGGMDAGVDAGPQLSFAADIQPIFNTRCNAACHNNASMNGGLNLTAGNSHGALVAQGTSAGCNGGQRVVAFDPKASQLWKKLTPDGGYCNNTMPRNVVQLRLSQPAEFNRIETWILQGAKNN